MRISFVTDTWLPEINGVTTVLATMHRGLQRRGHAVQVIAPRYGRMTRTIRPTSCAVRRSSMPGYAYSRLALPFDRGTGRALRAFRPDLVHVVTEGPLGAAGRRFAISAQIPLVTSFHTDFPRYAARYLGRWAVASGALVSAPLSRRRGGDPDAQRGDAGSSWLSWGCPGPGVGARRGQCAVFAAAALRGAPGGHGRRAPHRRAAREPAGGGKGRGHAGGVIPAGP